MGKIWEFFENLNDAVYVTDMDTHELIYVNKKVLNACNLHSVDEIAGRKCYELLQNCNAPCALCNMDALEEGKFVEWQHYNPRLNKFHILKDTMVIDEGRRFRIEIAIDNSIHEQNYRMFLEQQNHETLANEGIRLAMRAETPNKSLDIIMEFLGQALHAARTYIFEKNESGGDDNTYEWVAKDVTPSKDDLQNLSPEVCADWYRAFSEDRNVIIKDVESIRESDPVKYEILKSQNINSLVVIPIYNNADVIGFYGVDNPKEVSFEYIQNMLQIVGYFIASCIKRRNLVKQLEEMSYNDPLTKLGNRFAMDKYMALRDPESSLGVVYCDITGLKKVNDTKGHMAGDNLILRACDSLEEVFAGYGLFRIGGDELLALCSGIEHEKFMEKVAELKQAACDHSVVLAVGAVWYEKKSGGIDNYLVEAERLMYADKSAYYKRTGIDRRR